jgi:hypothetical protein
VTEGASFNEGNAIRAGGSFAYAEADSAGCGGAPKAGQSANNEHAIAFHWAENLMSVGLKMKRNGCHKH